MLVVPRPFYTFSTIFCYCLLSFPHRFYCSRLALFRSATCLCLISSCVSCYVCHFLWFGFSFLHIILAADTSYCSLFLFIVLLHISFHAYLFIQKDLDLCGPNNVDWIKKVLGRICLYLPLAIILENCVLRQSYILLQIAFPCISFFGPPLLFGLLGGLLSLAFHWAFLYMDFWVWIYKKMGINKLYTCVKLVH